MYEPCISDQYFMLQKVFRHSWKNMHLRSCQILYWPIFLQDTSLSSTVNVEYAHRAAIQKHALWSNVVMDLLMGFILGAALLLNTETICSWTFALVHYMTDGVLRSGCVWLMGVPAGFKLNTELAELLGMISLNAIQIYSTLWFIVGGFLRHIIHGLAFSGILLGFTVPVSFFIDIIQLATLHVRMLQWLVSLIYSRQIQTVTSLWHIFRRQRFPAGLLFLPVSLSSVSTDEYEALSVECCSTSGCDERKTDHLMHVHSGPLVSELSCNYATLGQVIGPNYRKVFNGIGFPFCKQLAYGILSGARIPSTLHLQFSPFPWIHIGIREYWMLCRGSVFSYTQKR